MKNGEWGSRIIKDFWWQQKAGEKHRLPHSAKLEPYQGNVEWVKIRRDRQECGGKGPSLSRNNRIQKTAVGKG